MLPRGSCTGEGFFEALLGGPPLRRADATFFLEDGVARPGDATRTACTDTGRNRFPPPSGLPGSGGGAACTWVAIERDPWAWLAFKKPLTLKFGLLFGG